MTGPVRGDPRSDEHPALLTRLTGLSVRASGRCSGGQVHHKQKCSQAHAPTDKHHAFTSSQRRLPQRRSEGWSRRGFGPLFPHSLS